MGRCQPAAAPGGHWQWVAGDGKRQEKGKTSHTRPFPCPPQHKALFPPDHAAPWVLLLPLSQKKCFILPAQAMKSNGKVPPRALFQPPSPAPLKMGKALSYQYLSLDSQMLWGLRNKSNLTNCPHVPACFLPPGPPQQEGEERTKDTQINERKTHLNSKRGRKSTVTHSSKHDWHKGQPAPAPSWNCTRRELEFRCPQGLSQGHATDQSWIGHGEHPSSVSLSSPSQGDTPRVPRSCRGKAELKLQPTSLHKRHQQQSPAQEPPQGTVWGQR